MLSKRFGRKCVKKQHPDDVQGFKLSTSQKMYNPVEMQDTRYLEQTSQTSYQTKRNARREHFKEKRIVTLEMNRLMNELHRPNLPHATTEHMEKRI